MFKLHLQHKKPESHFKLNEPKTTANVKPCKNNYTREELTLLYTKVMQFLQKSEIKITLFYGSLLGYFRDNDFIENDDDIDVIVSRNDYNKLMNYLNINLPNEPSIKLGITHKNIIQLYHNHIGPFDIYIYDTHLNNILLKWDGYLLFDNNLIFELKPVIFKNIEIYIPSNIEKIIVLLYGLNWNVKQVKNVDYVWENVTTVKKMNNTRAISRFAMFK
jgi:hypothetical protein